MQTLFYWDPLINFLKHPIKHLRTYHITTFWNDEFIIFRSHLEVDPQSATGFFFLNLAILVVRLYHLKSGGFSSSSLVTCRCFFARQMALGVPFWGLMSPNHTYTKNKTSKCTLPEN